MHAIGYVGGNKVVLARSDNLIIYDYQINSIVKTLKFDKDLNDNSYEIISLNGESQFINNKFEKLASPSNHFMMNWKKEISIIDITSSTRTTIYPYRGSSVSNGGLFIVKTLKKFSIFTSEYFGSDLCYLVKIDIDLS